MGVTMIGSDYVGLASSAYLEVLYYDVFQDGGDSSKINRIGRTIMQIDEANSCDLVANKVSKERGHFSFDEASVGIGASAVGVKTKTCINETREQTMACKVVQAMGGVVQGETSAVLGLTFKPNTGESCDARWLDFIPAMQTEGGRIRAFDPESMHEAQRHFQNVAYATSTTEAIQGADALEILTEWDAVKARELGKLKTRLSAAIVVETRNMFSIAEMNRYGIRYFDVGRPQNSSQISNTKELQDVSC